MSEISGVKLECILNGDFSKVNAIPSQLGRSSCTNTNNFLAKQLLCIIQTVGGLKANNLNHHRLVYNYILGFASENFLQMKAIYKRYFINISIRYIDEQQANQKIYINIIK